MEEEFEEMVFVIPATERGDVFEASNRHGNEGWHENQSYGNDAVVNVTISEKNQTWVSR